MLPVLPQFLHVTRVTRNLTDVTTDSILADCLGSCKNKENKYALFVYLVHTVKSLKRKHANAKQLTIDNFQIGDIC